MGIYLFARVGMTLKGVNRFFIFEICLPDRMNKSRMIKKLMYGYWFNPFVLKL